MANTNEGMDHPSSWDNSKLTVEVTHAEHPGKFFCRLKEDVIRYESFKKDLRILYEANETYLRIDSNRLDNADQKGLVVKHEGSYKRAKMLTVEDNQVTVFLLDEGGTIVVDRNFCFMPAPYSYMKRPKFAFRCHLFDIRPKQSNGIDSYWMDNAREYFIKEVTNNSNVTIIRRCSENEIRFDGRPSLPVEILLSIQEADDAWSRSKQIMKFVSSMMIAKDFAAYRMSDSELMVNESDDETDEIMSESGTEHNISVDNLLIEDELDRDDISENNSCKNENIFSDITPLYSKPVQRWPSPLIPFYSVGHNIHMRVTNVDSTGQIYAHLHENRHHLRQMKSTFAALYDNEIDLDSSPPTKNEFAMSRPAEDTTKSEWKIHEVCVVKYSQDNNWYRGQLVEGVYQSLSKKSKRDSDATVFLVDIGVYFRTYTSELRIPFHFGDLPILACRLVLDNVWGLNGERAAWPEENTENLFKFLEYGKKKCSKDGVVVVIQTRETLNFPIPIELKICANDTWYDLSKRLVDDWKQALWIPKGRMLDLENVNYLLEANGIEANTEKTNIDVTNERALTPVGSLCDQNMENTSPCSENSELIDDLSLSPWQVATRCFYIGEVLKIRVLTFFTWERFMTVYLDELNPLVIQVVNSLKKYSSKCLPIIKPRPGLPVTCFVDKKWRRGFIMQVKQPSTTENAITRLGVRFVDYNESKWVNNGRYVRALSEKLIRLPMYSFKVYCDEVRPSVNKGEKFVALTTAINQRQILHLEVTNGGLHTNKVSGKLI